MTTGLWAIIWFTLTYMTIASGVNASPRTIGNSLCIMVVIVIALAALAVHRSVGLSTGVLLCLSMGLFHMIGGLVPCRQTGLSKAQACALQLVDYPRTSQVR